MPLAMAEVHTERLLEDGIAYVYIHVAAGAGSYSPDSLLVRAPAPHAAARRRTPPHAAARRRAARSVMT